MTKEIVQALRCTSTPGSLHEDCIERLTAENAALREKVPQWVSVEEGGKADA